jgi:hypothetical protein
VVPEKARQRARAELLHRKAQPDDAGQPRQHTLKDH